MRRSTGSRLRNENLKHNQLIPDLRILAHKHRSRFKLSEIVVEGIVFILIIMKLEIFALIVVGALCVKANELPPDWRLR